MPTPTPEPSRLRACIVDEHEVVRCWLTGRLESLGLEVSESSPTIAEGLAAILRHLPDLVVVDDRLPDGPGIDLCRTVSASAPDVTLILHAGMISQAEENLAHEAGVTRIALKSIQGADLMEAVTEFLVRRRPGVGSLIPVQKPGARDPAR